jgi:hypothetical protein
MYNNLKPCPKCHKSVPRTAIDCIHCGAFDIHRHVSPVEGGQVAAAVVAGPDRRMEGPERARAAKLKSAKFQMALGGICVAVAFVSLQLGYAGNALFLLAVGAIGILVGAIRGA